MRNIEAKEITRTVSRLCQEACYKLPDYVLAAYRRGRDAEESPDGKDVFDKLLENAEYAASEGIPLCQDCGVTVIFLEVGQDAHIVGGDIYAAVNEGVRQGYTEGFLRKSVVDRPFTDRTNTKDNTPAVINTEIVPGDKLKIIVAPKGGGDFVSRLAILTPAEGREGVIDFVAKTVENAGSFACPPYIVGVGIGGTIEKTLLLARKALLWEVGKPSPDAETAELEREILQKVNNLGIGPMGYGGRMTALSAHVEFLPCHMAHLPVAVNLGCHSLRQQEATL